MGPLSPRHRKLCQITKRSKRQLKFTNKREFSISPRKRAIYFLCNTELQWIDQKCPLIYGNGKTVTVTFLAGFAGWDAEFYHQENPDCWLDRFVVWHIFVAARAGSPDGSIWALCKKIFHFQSSSTPIELPSGLARFAAPAWYVR